MGRVEKRRIERSLKKDTKHQIKEDFGNHIWFEKLPLSRKIYIAKYVEKKTIENDNLVASILDRCFASSLDDNLDINNLDIKRIINKSNEYIAEYKEYLDKEGNEGYNMIENKEIREECKEKIIKYMAGKMQKARALKLLKNEFNLPFAELSDLWMACKIEVSGDQKSNKKTVKTKDLLCKDIDEVKYETMSGDKSKLKVVNIIREIQGEYSTYVKNNNGVRVGINCYKDKNTVEEKRKAVEASYDDEICNIEEQIEKLNVQLRDIEDKYHIEMKRYDELLEVFDL